MHDVTLLGAKFCSLILNKLLGHFGYIRLDHLPKKDSRHQRIPILSQRLPKFVHFPDRVEFVLAADILILNPQPAEREESSALRNHLYRFGAKFLKLFNLFRLVQMVKKELCQAECVSLRDK